MPNDSDSLKPLRIALAITKLGIGGAESQVRDLAVAFKRSGMDVDVISLRAPEAHVLELKAEGIAVHSLCMESPLHFASALMKLIRHYRTFAPDVVHSHCYHANILCRLSKLFCPKVKLICTAHSLFEISRKRGKATRAVRDALYRLTDRLANFNTHVSQLGLERYLEARLFREANSKLVPNGIAVSEPATDAERSMARNKLGWEPNTFVWLHAGRFTAAKNQKMLIEAFAAVAQSHPNAILAIAGEGELETEIKRYASAAGIDSKVIFLGKRDDVPALMASADGFVLSSNWEGLPMVLLEAGMAGLPCVSTDVGSVADAIGDSDLLAPANDKDRLAQAMLTLTNMEPEQRRQRGAALRSRIVERYAIEKVVRVWQGIYSEVAAKRRQ